jgi:DNA-binding winged helix-turn-helix (wHTH) protein
MRYNINGRLIYNATDGTLTLPGSDEPDSQLSFTVSALLYFFLCHTEVVSRVKVLEKVWDEKGLTSSNSNLNQYLSMLRKILRHYEIDNIVVTVSRGYLQLNPDISIEMLDASPPPGIQPQHEPVAGLLPLPVPIEPVAQVSTRMRSMYWYISGTSLLALSLLLVFSVFDSNGLRPIPLTRINHSACKLLASDEILRSVTGTTYGKNFDAVRQRLNLECKPNNGFVFFYGDRLETNGLGRVFLAHCAVHKDSPFSYCNNYFYYAWKQ